MRQLKNKYSVTKLSHCTFAIVFVPALNWALSETCRGTCACKAVSSVSAYSPEDDKVIQARSRESNISRSKRGSNVSKYSKVTRTR